MNIVTDLNNKSRPRKNIFSHEQARIFYDRFGSKQDWQCFYEKSAVTDLLAHFDLGPAKYVIEFGWGTGY